MENDSEVNSVIQVDMVVCSIGDLFRKRAADDDSLDHVV